MSKEDLEACTGTYKYKVLGYRTKYCPQTKKQEHVQRRGWDITEHFVRDLTPEERKSAEEDIKSGDTEEYIQLQMPKSYWEKLIKYIQQSIDEENIVNILKQIKDGKIKLESLSIQTQQKVNYILKAKKSQYVIIIPMDKSLGMDESAIRSKYSLSELKSDIKKRDRRQEYWIYCYNIKIYFYLMLTISLDIVDAHPEYRTHQFVKEMSYLHLGVMDGNQNTASSCSKKERIHVQTQAQDDQILGENPHKKQKLNSQEQSEVVEGNQNQIAQQQMEPTSPIQTISVFQNDNNQNSVQMEQQQEATNATQQTETKENNQKKLENELNSVISDDIEQKIDMFQKCRAAAVACKEQQECDSFITCVQNQEKLIKIQNMKSTKASYVKNKKVKTFEEVMILHTTIFDSILNVIQNYTQQSKDGIKERSKIKKRLTKHFPQNYFGQYIDKLMQENDNQMTQNKQ